MESTFSSVSFFEAVLVFQCSMRSFTRSACVVFELASSCASNPFNCVTDAYETGWLPCMLGAAVAAGPDCPCAAVMHESVESPSAMRKVRFIFERNQMRDQSAYYKDLQLWIR